MSEEAKRFDPDNPFQEGPRLTRWAMEQVINTGGSVLHKGQVLTGHQELPSDAELAAGSPEAEARARAQLKETIARLEGQLTMLGTKVPHAGESVTAEPTKPAGAAPERPAEAPANATTEQLAELQARSDAADARSAKARG